MTDRRQLSPAARIHSEAAAGPSSQWLLALLLLVPSLLLLALFTYGPLIQLAWDSLLVRTSTRAAPSFAGLANYRAVLNDPSFAKALWNNLLFAIGTLVPSLVLALFLAMCIARSSRLNSGLRAMLFFPVLVPLVAAASLFLFIFLPGVGLLDYYLGRLIARPPNWLGDPDIALWAIAGVTIWKNAGYYMLFFLAGLQSVPPEAYDAAYLDGATPWQRLWMVTLPYLTPTIAFVSIIALLNIVTQVDHVFVLTKGGPSEATNLLLFYIYQQAVESYDIGKASAATVLSLVALFAVTLLSLSTLERSFGGNEL
ncbi:carbohydrate ABC transporter permease [Candidatus Raskinella chloraquaticus]|uniref:carbohydrate ABC transporter permease n=1 Tax=Candidatus Raskinella chloraquaticus TaxID=1951219 RepID=UPI00366DCAA9